MDENKKKEFEAKAEEILKDFASKHDSDLYRGGFADKENYSYWDEEYYVINLYTITQDDFFSKFELFEELETKLKTELDKIIGIEKSHYEADCPILYIKTKQ